VNVLVSVCVYTFFIPVKFYNEASYDYRLIAYLFAEFASEHTHVYSEIPFASANDIFTIPFSATVFVDNLSSN